MLHGCICMYWVQAESRHDKLLAPVRKPGGTRRAPRAGMRCGLESHPQSLPDSECDECLKLW